MSRKGIGSHQSPAMISDTWLTPPEIITSLGEFDLDPCCPPTMPWSSAKTIFTEREDGLSQPWAGRVWLNPPYNRDVVKWMRKLADHGNGIALVFARTETEWFFETVWNAPSASACLFIKGRLHFHHEDGSRAENNSGAPSVLVAYGLENAIALLATTIPGRILDL